MALRRTTGPRAGDGIWSAVRLVAIGTAIGIPATIVAGRSIAAQFFSGSAGDPVTVASAAALLVLVGALAAYVPARRASHVDPILTLRSE